MSGELQALREFPDAIIEYLGVVCGSCAGTRTVLVSIGDPHGPEEVLDETPEMSVTQLSGVSFVSCKDCGNSWEIERS